MSNKTVGILLILLILIGAGSYYQKAQQAKKNIVQQSNIISSVKDAFVSGLSISCRYEEEGDGSLQVYIRDGAIRFNNTLSSNEATVDNYIHKDDVTHMWNGAGGIIFRDISKNSYDEEAPLFMTRDEALASLEQYKDFCQIARFEHTVYIQPEAVGFVEVRNSEQALAIPESL